MNIDKRITNNIYNILISFENNGLTLLDIINDFKLNYNYLNCFEYNEYIWKSKIKYSKIMFKNKFTKYIKIKLPYVDNYTDDSNTYNIIDYFDHILRYLNKNYKETKDIDTIEIYKNNNDIHVYFNFVKECMLLHLHYKQMNYMYSVNKKTYNKNEPLNILYK